MADSGAGNEKSGFGQFVRKQKKYGTTTKPAASNESYLKHYLSQGETLQGIALKYGVSMEHLKRVNKIWTNESLHIKDYILVPLITANPFEGPKLPAAAFNGDNAPPGAAVSRSSTPEIVTQQDLSESFKKQKEKSSRTETIPSQPASKPAPSAKDFLSKYDSNIAQLKSKVHELESTSQFQEDSSNPLNLLPSRRGSRYMSRQKSHSWDSDYSDPSAEPQLLIKDRHRTKRIQTSLEQLQKNQDDLFQL